MDSTLTDKQQRFVEEYLVDMNATQAAIRAGYSERTAGSIGHENLTKPEIKEAIEKAQRAIAETLGITVAKVLKEYARIGFLDPRKVLNDDGTMRPISELDDDTAAAIAGLEVHDLYEGRGEDREMVGRAHKIKLADKKGALDSIARHLGMFNDKMQFGGTLQVGGQVNVYLPDNGRDKRS
jgi:phage terminase small subunit